MTLNTPIILSRFISIWMILISGTISIAFHSTLSGYPFFSIGPSANLLVMGVCIDNYTKYSLFVVYCIVNTFIRSLNNYIVAPYITLEIQGEKNPKSAYEIVLWCTIYYWFDWVIYINLLLSQIDFVVIEMVTDIIMKQLITYWYIHYNDGECKHPNVEL